MEKLINSYEKPKINFLDKNLWVTYEIENEALEHLPEISSADLESHQERYGLLLGDFIVVNGKVQVIVKSVMQMEPHERGYYSEEKDTISGVNIPAIQQLVKRIQEANPKYRKMNLIGEFHTHARLPQEYENGMLPWEPSSDDIESIVLEYANRVLSPNQPFIFAVAGPTGNLETLYEFYKINKSEDNTYSYEKILRT